MLKIGYFADGPWAHNALQKIMDDKTIEIKFLTVRYDKRDPVLIKIAGENHIPVEFFQNINTEDSFQRLKHYNVDLFVSMSFNQIFRKK